MGEPLVVRYLLKTLLFVRRNGYIRAGRGPRRPALRSRGVRFVRQLRRIQGLSRARLAGLRLRPLRLALPFVRHWVPPPFLLCPLYPSFCCRVRRLAGSSTCPNLTNTGKPPVRAWGEV